MIATVTRSEDGLAVKLTPAMAAALGIDEGSVVEVSATPEAKASAPPQGEGLRFRYSTTEEFLAAFEKSRERYDSVYRELAK